MESLFSGFVGIVVVVAVILPLLTMAETVKRLAAELRHVQGKLDVLLKQVGGQYDPYSTAPKEVCEALMRGESKIRVIAMYRKATGTGLKEAKDYVEELMRRTGT